MHKHYPIKRLNSWRLGTSVRWYSEPKSLEELLEYYQMKKHMRTIWLGLGSNIMFPDHELEAHVIKAHKALSQIIFSDDVYIEAGVPLAKVAKCCAKRGFEKAAFFAGIPGALGGALMMNAGAYGHETWQFVKSVNVLTTTGIEKMVPSQFEIGYRVVKPPKGFIAFLSANLSFDSGCSERAQGYIKQYLKQRNHVQPIGTFNCGSVFQNPQVSGAGILIDRLGLKGLTVGGARVSPMHGNFIENINAEATTHDVKKLIKMLQEKVYDAHRIMLTPEVVIYE